MTDHNLMARMVPQRSTYRHALSKKHIVIPKRSIYYKGGIPKQHKPCFYPPPIQHQTGYPFGMVKPILFPAGFHTYKNLVADKLLTVKDIINDMSTAAKPPTFVVHWYGTAGALVPPYPVILMYLWYIALHVGHRPAYSFIRTRSLISL